ELRQATDGPGQQASFPPSKPIEGTCGAGGYTPSNYAMAPDRLPADAPAELHVVTVSEGAAEPGFHDQRLGTVAVYVHPRPKPIVLYLNGYGAVRWRLHVDAGTRLERVITA